MRVFKDDRNARSPWTCEWYLGKARRSKSFPTKKAATDFGKLKDAEAVSRRVGVVVEKSWDDF